jgi:hypothetical protein
MLSSIRTSVRLGKFDVADVERLTAIRHRSPEDTLEHLSAVSLAAEICEQLGDYSRSARVVDEIGEKIVQGFHDHPVDRRFTGSEDLRCSQYKLVRQQLWCALAYCQSLYHHEKSGEAVRQLEFLRSEIDRTVNRKGWPEGLRFHGTRSRLEYYLGLNLRAHPAAAMDAFGRSSFHAVSRLSQQYTNHRENPARLLTEYRYAMDCIAKLMTFGYAWSHIGNANLRPASSTLDIAQVLIESSENPYLKRSVDLLRLQVKRHRIGYSADLKATVSELISIRDAVAGHPSHWARAQFELGLHLVNLLRFQEMKGERFETATLDSMIEHLANRKKPGGVVTNPVEREFQVAWLRVLQRDFERNFDNALVWASRLELILGTNAARAEEEPLAWPLQYWTGQAPLLKARVYIRKGDFQSAQEELANTREIWSAGPPFVRLLGLTREGEATLGCGGVSRAKLLLDEARLLLPSVEAEWVRQEFSRTLANLEARMQESQMAAGNRIESLTPAERHKRLIQDEVEAELTRQREAYPGKLQGSGDIWYQDEAFERLGLKSRKELEDWLHIAGRQIENKPGRPPTRQKAAGSA